MLTKIGIFFSQLAVVTFGGAYAVLAYMAQAAVQQHGWLTAPEMIDGLALAETTPGPLILVTQFVGYLAALRGMGSIWGGLAGAGSHPVDDLCPLLPLDLRRRSLHRAYQPDAPPFRRPGGHHRRRGGRHS